MFSDEECILMFDLHSITRIVFGSSLYVIMYSGFAFPFGLYAASFKRSKENSLGLPPAFDKQSEISVNEWSIDCAYTTKSTLSPTSNFFLVFYVYYISDF